MEAVVLASEAHQRLGLIVSRADALLASLEARERLARRIRRAHRRSGQPSFYAVR